MRSNIGHRQRVKQRFRDEGLKNFEESNALEFLLFYVVPRKDTKPLARRLLDYFGSFSKVLDADIDSLQEVEGVGIAVATYLRAICEAGRYYQVSRDKQTPKLDDLNLCGEYLVKYFHGVKREVMYLLCLDASCHVICCRELGEGDVTTMAISPRRIMEVALSSGATSVVLAHNHPGGSAEPSDADILATRHICATLASVEILLVDHMIIRDGDFVSMVQSGSFNPKDYRLVLL